MLIVPDYCKLINAIGESGFDACPRQVKATARFRVVCGQKVVQVCGRLQYEKATLELLDIFSHFIQESGLWCLSSDCKGRIVVN